MTKTHQPSPDVQDMVAQADYQDVFFGWYHLSGPFFSFGMRRHFPLRSILASSIIHKHAHST